MTLALDVIKYKNNEIREMKCFILLVKWYGVTGNVDF